MLITSLILGYIASVFFCRWANKMLYQRIEYCPKIWGWWYIPIINFGILIPIFFEILDNFNSFKFDNKFWKWFRGDHW